MAEARGWSPVPNEVLDRVMPGLRDTELRLLLVVARATLGRRDPFTGKRKARDWFSHAQLAKRAGRGGAAVSRALAALVARGLLRAETEGGEALPTPRARRAHRGRVFLSLAPGLRRAVEPPEEPPAALPAPSPRPKRPSGGAAVRVRRGWERAGSVR